ncbi:glycosyl hydrolase family 8 [Leptolyngbya sp. O-77]|uniref:glycosyl hydrolase family 8 n=1 Tax=Leptolyngbya sp. O-77 TaxID=1080068 RepID=UPI00074D40B3|nr:glycosyl hydrolase family 8 [Leptolyngbya sp. O-77]BAU41182.1 Endoglucanase precursor [Leptolyngbya sp. O-77]
MQFFQFAASSLRPWAIALVLVFGSTLAGCNNSGLSQSTPPDATVVSQPGNTSEPTPAAIASKQLLLAESWSAYRERFIQQDGRVIDWEADERTTSEGQAYAMLRAVFIDDPETFAQTLNWAEENLQRLDASGKRRDNLWAWKWGKDADGNWTILDENFASDADIDAVTALILAARRWNRPDYLQLARIKLRDLWTLSTVAVPLHSARSSNSQPAREQRYLLPGPKEAFQPQPDLLHLNPSYLAPYAFRLFAQVDGDRNWMSLVDSSYKILRESSQLSSAKLPSDWVALNTTTGSYIPLRPPSPIRSIYGFDAYRVWWRVGIDAQWFNEPAAWEYLQQHLPSLESKWKTQQKIPAQIDLQGQPLVPYESTSQYGMLFAAFQLTNPQIAEQIYQQKILPVYQNGFWDNNSAYYAQNLAWFGLLASTDVAVNWLQP